MKEIPIAQYSQNQQVFIDKKVFCLKEALKRSNDREITVTLLLYEMVRGPMEQSLRRTKAVVYCVENFLFHRSLK